MRWLLDWTLLAPALWKGYKAATIPLYVGLAIVLAEYMTFAFLAIHVARGSAAAKGSDKRSAGVPKWLLKGLNYCLLLFITAGFLPMLCIVVCLI